jgi:hypothetical protein
MLAIRGALRPVTLGLRHRKVSGYPPVDASLAQLMASGCINPPMKIDHSGRGCWHARAT